MRRYLTTTNLQLALLAVFTPATFIAHFAHASPAAIFVLGCVAILPLAYFMGHATEAIAHKLGSGLGGLLNATFGNAAELIIALAALRAGHPEVVKASLTGSILGNLLLILGLSMLLGGMGRKSQQFSAKGAEAGAAMMLLATIALYVPSIFHLTLGKEAVPALFPMSEVIAGVLIFTYALSLWFQFKTHAHLYTDEPEVAEEAPWSMKAASAVLVASTVGVALVSEVIIHALEGAIATFGFTRTFTGVVVLATVGNAAEHSTAILMAMKDKMNLAFNIAWESSKQIALFVAPVLVFASLMFGHPMDLEFHGFEVLAVGSGVAAATLIALDGESNWFEGAMLLAVYVVLGTAFFFIP
jgi:Ca2+:H+ antiporter